MSLVIIINRLGIGGAERLAVDEANELYRRGIPFTLVTLRREQGNSYALECAFPQSDFICIPFNSLFDVRQWIALVRLLRSKRPDAVITHLWFSNTIGRIAARIAGISHVISFEHNVYDKVKTGKQFAIDRLLQHLSSHIIAVSSAVRDSLVSHGIDALRIVVIPNGIDLSRYQSAKPSSIRDELSLGSEFLFLYVGRLIHQKGVDILLDAFAQVEGAHLLIAGDGIDRAILEQKAADLGLGSRVHFLGVRNDIPSLMKSADCFVLPSRHEGMPMVLIEALACGMPIIISDFSAAREIVRDGESGLIVPIGNTEALAQSMRRLLQDRTQRDALSKHALVEVTNFSIQTHLDLMIACLN